MALAGWAQCAVYFWQCLGWSRWNIGQGIMMFIGYYSNWAMFLMGLAGAIVALDSRGRRAPWVTTLALICTITMSLGYWSAMTWAQYRTNPFFHQSAHGPLPLALLLFWLTCIRHGLLRYRDALIWPIVPIVYTVWMLLYGLTTDYYPYWQLNPTRVGWRHIAVSIIQIAIATYAAGIAIVWLDRALGRQAIADWARARLGRRPNTGVPAALDGDGLAGPIEP